MYRIIGIVFVCLGIAVISVPAQRDHCFKNDGLKVSQTVSFTLTKTKLEGTFETGGYDRETSAETFEFTGTKAGNLLTIKFARKPPYEIPRGTKKIVWTLGSKTLRVPMYGKNYTTMKYSNYTAIFDRCKEI